ncbi:unnamed protein product [Pylaiella littoralis]
MAWFRLIVGGVVLLLGVPALVSMYRSRYILDIRTRSVHLVLLAGGALLLSFVVAINESVLMIWGMDYAVGWFWSSLMLFFVTPIIFGSYICRALRLAVVFHPRAKRALPWLIPERNYMILLVLMAIGFLAIPIYHEYTLEIWEIIPEQTDILATLSLVFVGVLALIFPFIRKVDDLFNISTELIIATVLLMILAVGSKIVEELAGPVVIQWVSRGNLTFLMALLVFWVSVVDPLRRLTFDPLAATKRNRASRLLLAQRAGRSTMGTVSSGFSDREDVVAADNDGRVSKTGSTRLEEGLGGIAPRATAAVASSSAAAPQQGALSPSPEPGAPEAGNWQYQGTTFAVPATAGVGEGGGGSTREVAEVWDFERLARTPLLAAAFEDFSRKALCHECVLFLSEVSRYQNNDFSDTSSGDEPLSQYQALWRITDLYIRTGAREEVNISDEDRKRIVGWADKGEAWFAMETREERRLVFGQAYVEVRSMLEDNLLRRFLQTDQFKSVRAQRQNITTMMVSPPKNS